MRRRGYDLAAFAAAGASEAVGLELSVTAVQDATAYLGEALSGMSEEVRLKSRVLQADFYTFSAEPFDIGYDYTVRFDLTLDLRFLLCIQTKGDSNFKPC